MISKDQEFLFAVGIRQRIIDMLAGIENASWSSFNDRSPNWLTKKNINELIDEFEKGMKSLGAVPFSAHAPCGHRLHEKRATWKMHTSVGYWRYALDDGRTDLDLVTNGQTIIENQVMETDFDLLTSDQWLSSEPCACAPGQLTEPHTVMRYYFWTHDPTSCISDFAELIFFFRRAVALSNDNRPRAAIREQLLLAIVSLERLLVPVSAHDEIKRRGSQ